MRLLEITFTDPKLPGGVERLAIQLGEFLTKSSIQVSYMYSGDKNQIFYENGVKKIILKCNKKFFPKIMFNIKVYLHVKNHKSDYDIIHINGDNGDLVTAFKNIKTIMTVHGIALRDGLSMRGDKSVKTLTKLYKLAWAYISNFFEIYAIKRAGVIATTSNVYLDFIKFHRKKEDAIVIMSGVDTNFFHPGNKKKVREELSLDENGIYGIWVGQESKRKRLDFSIELIEETGLNLICIGNIITDKRCSNRISLLNNVDDEVLLKYYQAADFFLFPSVSEGFALVIMEAMACGAVPIIGENIKIPIMFDRRNCFIAKNESEFLKIIKEIDSNGSILAEMSENAISSAKELSIQKNLSKYLELITNYYNHPKSNDK